MHAARRGVVRTHGTRRSHRYRKRMRASRASERSTSPRRGAVRARREGRSPLVPTRAPVPGAEFPSPHRTGLPGVAPEGHGPTVPSIHLARTHRQVCRLSHTLLVCVAPEKNRSGVHTSPTPNRSPVPIPRARGRGRVHTPDLPRLRRPAAARVRTYVYYRSVPLPLSFPHPSLHAERRE